jgi:predicted nucleic acid-binding protein
MIILVSDTSVLIDLERADIVSEALTLPYEFVVPDALYAAELEPFNGAELLEKGLRIESLDPNELSAATLIRRAQAKLSLPDTFALALAEGRQWTLLAGDGVLRAEALARRVPCHGTLWIFDELETAGNLDCAVLHARLEQLASHRRCRLPKTEISKRLMRYMDKNRK